MFAEAESTGVAAGWSGLEEAESATGVSAAGVSATADELSSVARA